MIEFSPTNVYSHAGKSHESFPLNGSEAKGAGGKSGGIVRIQQGNGNGGEVDGSIGERAESMDRYVRVAFCKEMSTLQAATAALKKAQARDGPFKSWMIVLLMWDEGHAKNV